MSQRLALTSPNDRVDRRPWILITESLLCLILLLVASPLPRADFSVCNHPRPVQLNWRGLCWLHRGRSLNSRGTRYRASKLFPLPRAKPLGEHCQHKTSTFLGRFLGIWRFPAGWGSNWSHSRLPSQSHSNAGSEPCL